MKEIENSLFYNALKHKADSKIQSLVSKIDDYVKVTNNQVYLLDKILGTTKKLNYDIKEVIYMVIPHYPVLLLFDDDLEEEDMQDFFEDLKEDLGQLSSKYNYNYILNRPRKWKKEWFLLYKWRDFDFDCFISQMKAQGDDVRRIDLIISLITGSINDADKIGTEPLGSLLDKVKRRIMLFDGTQSRFIYDKPKQKKIFVQGLAGTGKTELLMRKLREIYIEEKESRIAFTCHNIVLANEMKNRIEKFFNFMKVEEQIDWDKRLKVFHAWGSRNDNRMGMYSYICKKCNIPFLSLKEAGEFNIACEKAIKALEENQCNEKLFDYIFIDESQDFDNSFFDLCEKVCEKSLFIAGDIFQSIFAELKNSDFQADFVLDRCYRTDPRTLMFAHSIGMGLYEQPKLNWLTNQEWEYCGYQIEEDRSKKFVLTRKPIRRFEDAHTEKSIAVQDDNLRELYKVILNYIKQLRNEYENLNADDIGVIFICNDYSKMIACAYYLRQYISDNLKWNATIGIETKCKESNSIFISNTNNVKGLEFPFTISVLLMDVGDSITLRNSLYMSLTRSFISSLLVIDRSTVSTDFITTYKKVAEDITNKEKLELVKPTQQEIDKMKNNIRVQVNSKLMTKEQLVLDYLRSQDKFKTLGNENIKFIRDKVNKDWFLLSGDEILEKVARLAESLV
jgi:putative helicase